MEDIKVKKVSQKDINEAVLKKLGGKKINLDGLKNLRFSPSETANIKKQIADMKAAEAKKKAAEAKKKAAEAKAPPKTLAHMVKKVNDSKYNGAFDTKGRVKKGEGNNFQVANPDWVSSRSEKDGGNIQKAYEGMFQEGRAPEMSRWGQAAYDRSRQDQGFAVDDASQQAMGDAAANMNTLALQGGVDSGAAQNMMMQGQRNANTAKTNLYRQGMMDRSGINVADASRKDDMVRQGLSGGMDVARFNTDVQSFNVGNRIQDRQAQNDFDAARLGLQGQLLGGAANSNAMIKQSQTTANAPSVGNVFGFTTALNQWGRDFQNAVPW